MADIQRAVAIVGDGNGNVVLCRIVGVALSAIINFADGVVVSFADIGLSVGDFIKRNSAVSSILCGLQHIAVSILQLEGELLLFKRAASEFLDGAQRH